MADITIFGFAPSTYTQTALLVAAEVGADADVAPVAFGQASHLALHPYAKMPAMRRGELELYETLAIASYLDRAFDGGLEPSDPVARARMMQWISVALDYAYDALVRPMHDDEPSADAISGAAKQLKLLDEGLGDGPWLAGGSMSLADLFLYPMVEYAAPKVGAEHADGLTALNRWRAAMAERDSVKGLPA